jgi:hypothetical protein
MASREFRFGLPANSTWKSVRPRIQEVYGLGDPAARMRVNPLFPRGIERIDLSHFPVPQRSIGAYEHIFNRPWNTTPMWATEHALVDPWRYQFMIHDFQAVYDAERFSGAAQFMRLLPPWMRETGYGAYRFGAAKAQDQSATP